MQKTGKKLLVTLMVLLVLTPITAAVYLYVIGMMLAGAARAGDLNAVQRFVQYGADVNAADPELGTTPLICASEDGRLLVVRYLLDHGANINARTEHGDTALIFASSNGYSDVVKLLLQRGADRTIKGNEGLTAIENARQYKRTEVIEALNEH